MVDQFTLIIFLIVFIGFYIVNLYLYRGKTKNSLSYIETNYGQMKVFSGVFIGLGIYTLLAGNLINLDSESSNLFIRLLSIPINFIMDLPGVAIAFIYIIFGLILFTVSSAGLKANLFKPIREFSSTSAVYGKKSLMVRFPEIGALEMQEFAKNFNTNSKELANKISLLEIHKNKLTFLINEFNINVDNIDPSISVINDITAEFNNVLTQQNKNIDNWKNVRVNSAKLIESYEEATNQLINKLSESVEYFNLLTINIAIEAANTENETFEVIAEKSREFFNEFEDFTNKSFERLIVIENTFKKVFNEFNASFEKESDKSQINKEAVEKAKSVIRENEQYLGQIDNIQQQIMKTIEEFNKDFPASY
jgi:hypothetical protein